MMLPVIDRVGRRDLLLIGSISCMAVHFIIAGVMASKGNANLTWEIKCRDGGDCILLHFHRYLRFYLGMYSQPYS